MEWVSRMKKIFKEFKEFISRGNVMDMAVGVIIGGAFSAIVTALTEKIIMPLVNFVLAKTGGAEGLESAYTILNAGYTDGKLDLEKSIYIDWGSLIAAIFNFLIIALTVFIIVKAFNASKKRFQNLEGKALESVKEDIRKEKKEIKAKAEATGRKFKELWKEHEEAKAKAAAKKAEEEKAKAPKPDDILLLEQIKAELVKLNGKK